jgi:aminomethyltransferase
VEDRAWIESHLRRQTLRELDGQGLLALQGPAARDVLATCFPRPRR